MAPLLVLLGLLGLDLASAEGQTDKFPEPNQRSDSVDVYREIARKMHDVLKLHRKRQAPLIGQNEFEMMLARKLEGAQVKLPHERFMRFKRDIPANQFESGTTPSEWLRKSWEKVSIDLEAGRDLNHMDEIVLDAGTPPTPPEKYLTKKHLNAYNIVKSNLSLTAAILKGQNKLFKQTPSDFISAYASKRKTGCGCDINRNSIGCACCFYWMEADIVFCAGCGYIFKDMKFIVKITVQDFTLFAWEKEIAKSALARRLALFSKSLCIPHQFSAVVTACLQLSLSFNPSFDKAVPSKISACPGIIGQIALFFDVMLLELPCWELDFNLPFLRVAGNGGMARLTYESNRTRLQQPVKSMFTTENFDQVETLVRELGVMEKKYYSKFEESNEHGRIIENVGEDPRLLKKGTPTIPVNWKPTDEHKLQYLVVLYTQPLASPLTKNELEDEELKEIPQLLAMTQDGLDRRHEDPSHLNLKVKATLGKSCGGVILTPDKIMTLCACIKFFYLYHKYKEKPKKDDYQDVFTLISTDIYVTFADRNFTADQVIYELDQDSERFTKNSRCFDAIEKTKDKKTDVNSINLLHMHFAVMSVTKEFKSFETLTLVPWPNMDGARSGPTTAEMTIIGMRKTKPIDMFDAKGYEFDPMYEMVKVPIVSCHRTSFCSKAINPPQLGGKGASNTGLPKGFDENTQCFCAQDKDFHLCDGVVGFPVVTSQGLIGLNALPMHCRDEGSTLTAIFSRSVISEIEDHLSDRVSSTAPVGPPVTKDHMSDRVSTTAPVTEHQSRAPSTLNVYLPLPMILFPVIAQ